MPNTKSAEKRVRSNARKATRNQSVKSSVKTFEKKFLELATAGKLDEAKAALSVVTRLRCNCRREALRLAVSRLSTPPLAARA